MEVLWSACLGLPIRKYFDVERDGSPYPNQIVWLSIGLRRLVRSRQLLLLSPYYILKIVEISN